MVSINDVAGYPCPKCSTILVIIPASDDPPRDPGAWCPSCHTVWRELGEVSLADLDALPTQETQK